MSLAFVFQCVGNVSLGSESYKGVTNMTAQIVGPQVYLAREAPAYHTGQ
jgi:hypothetical protein